MAKYAVIFNGFVVNVVAWDGAEPWNPPEDHSLQLVEDDSDCGPGHSFDGTNFVAPASMFPTEPVVQNVEPETPEFSLPAPDPFTYNAIGYTTVAQGPLPTGERRTIDGKPGIWLIGDRIPGVEAYSVTRVA